MPVRIPEKLPAVSILKEENIFVMDSARAHNQDIRPLKIVVLNLMPIKVTTETDLIRLLSNTPLQVDLTLMKLESHTSKNTPVEHMMAFYRPFSELEKEKSELLTLTTEKAKALYAYRSKTAERFVESVTGELRFLDMPNVVIEVKHEKGKLSASGMDSVEFLISANKGEDPKPISKIASGGELSRIMLALKTVIADKDDIPTMIFDEIDTGVSGRAAQKIGTKLQEISAHRQVLCVTHLSQIAVMADSHLLIEKKTEGERTSTSVTKLDTDGRVREIARIMGGENPSGLMLESAREQLEINRRKM